MPPAYYMPGQAYQVRHDESIMRRLIALQSIFLCKAHNAGIRSPDTLFFASSQRGQVYVVRSFRPENGMDKAGGRKAFANHLVTMIGGVARAMTISCPRSEVGHGALFPEESKGFSHGLRQDLFRSLAMAGS
jgi:hypothetical protein